ncbi:MAG: hypothetical protein AAGI24_08440 [Pseudomonadota bacterium]
MNYRKDIRKDSPQGFQIQRFKVQEYSSRKLWEMVSATPAESDSSEEQLMAAVRELQQRQHYLAELQRIGKLKAR